MLHHEVKHRIESGIASSECIVHEFSGGTDHYSVIVVADAFEGQSSLARHRIIMDLFQAEVATGEVHALSIKALTKKQWEQEKHKYVAKPL
ncbi:BolA family protein [Spirobacillus cienkowskii]|jgi:acid stress-induced BolA-like protein IbaG/YrbA|uniref:BolA family transcriptional regulator n=1 Tax=Spirobacillus cienkowskii TaxID=495820 RepID=A0A369KUG8_9BACT|nr:MAG: BolA family transcriptional regulator [Spirobacillus cienkowskii]